MSAPDAIGLPALEAELTRQLALIGHGGADWTRPPLSSRRPRL